jgi:hypothetical protein
MGHDQTIAPTAKLLPSEERLVAAMRELGYGRFESVQIRRGELLLEPWPTTVRSIKFGGATPNRPTEAPGDGEPKKQISDLFAVVRGLDSGTIRYLEVRGGLPFCLELDEAR